jgi:hypothetical protein
VGQLRRLGASGNGAAPPALPASVSVSAKYSADFASRSSLAFAAMPASTNSPRNFNLSAAVRMMDSVRNSVLEILFWSSCPTASACPL